MRSNLIHFFVYTFMLVVCVVIDVVSDGHKAMVPFIFCIAYLTYPLVKYLQSDNDN